MGTAFMLNPNYKVAQGFNGICLYDILSGAMLDLDERHSRTLLQALKSQSNPSPELDEFVSLGVGDYRDSTVVSETFTPQISMAIDTLIGNRISIDRAYLVITPNCSLKCSFCNINLVRRTGCKEYCTPSCSLTIHDYKSFISQISALGCKTIVFSGGDPFLEFDLLKKLVEFAKEQGVANIEVISNGTLLPTYISRFVEAEVKLNLQLVDSGEVYLSIRQSLRMLRNVLVSILLSNNNVTSMETIENMIVEDSFPYVKDFVYSDILSNKILWQQANSFKVKFTRPRINDWIHLGKYSRCLHSQITLFPDGSVSACPMMDSWPLFNFRETSILDGLKESSQYLELATLTKDKVEKCKNCKFRYGCSDCRAIELNYTNNLYSSSFCYLINE